MAGSPPLIAALTALVKLVLSVIVSQLARTSLLILPYLAQKRWIYEDRDIIDKKTPPKRTNK
jgi:hypothetical protein